MSCVNTSLKEFKEASVRLDIHPNDLELIVHKFQNTQGNENKFPTDSEILSSIKGKAFRAANAQLDVYFKSLHYVPMTFQSENLAQSKIAELRTIYPDNAISTYKNNKGEYVVTVGTPVLEGIPFALDNSMIDTLSAMTVETNPYHQIFKTLVNLLGKNNITIEQRDASERPEGNPAVYLPDSSKIVFYTQHLRDSLKNHNYSGRNATSYVFQVLTHELVHNWAYQAIANPRTQAEAVFSKEINDLYQKAIQHFGENTGLYGLTDAQEFLAEALTNRAFQKKLTEIKSGKKSIWTKLLEALQKVFDFKIDNTILADVLITTDRFIEESTKEQVEHEEFLDAYFSQIAEQAGVAPYESNSLNKVVTSPNNRVTDYTYYMFKTKNGLYAVNIPVNSKDTFADSYNKVQNMLRENGLDPDKFGISRYYRKADGNRTVLYVSPRRNIAEKQTEAPKVNGTNFTEAELQFLTYLENVRPDLARNVRDGLLDVRDIMRNEDELGVYAPAQTEEKSTFNPNDFQEQSEQQASFIDWQTKVLRQINSLTEDNILSATEVRHIAEQAVYWISDHITDLQEQAGLAQKTYGDKFKDKDFSNMSRADVVRTIGVNNIVAMCKEKFSPENNSLETDDAIDKAITITDNWDAIMLLAQDVFLNVENFSIVNREGDVLEVNEDLNANIDDINNTNDQSTIEETQGSTQEHWQIEMRTLDIMNTMSQLVKRELLKCYLKDADGNTITSEFGINERVDVRTATNSILRWTRGALDLPSMINMLSQKAQSNPWVNQIIANLSDKSGKYADFQSQFFGTFSKHFQSYSIVQEKDGTYKSILVNENPALSEAVAQVTTQYKIGEHPLFNTSGVNKTQFEGLKEAFNALVQLKGNTFEVTDKNKEEIAKNLGYISNVLGYYVTPDLVSSILTNETFKSMYTATHYIIESVEKNLDNKDYDPFKFKAEGSINGNLRTFLKPITGQLEDTAVTSFYDSGKMYQSYVTPSYMTKLMLKFNAPREEFDAFIKEEYAKYSWFHTGANLETGWRNALLQELVNDDNARAIFKHKVQLNFNKHNYMRNMSDAEYALSLFAEYWSEEADSKQSRVPAWFRVPMLSNKPSSEFIRMYSERGATYKDTIADNMLMVFSQELSRIQTVEMRNLDKSSPEFIKNFDTNGKRFMFLDFLNAFLTGNKKTSELGKLIRAKLNGETVDDAHLNDLVKEEIKSAMESRAKSIVESWKEQGLIEAAKKIKGIGNTEEEIMANLENFVWNDTMATINITELTITDPAFYKDAEDLQKRFAQIHSPGTRANIYATDYTGAKVTDGKTRTFYLKDLDKFISNVIDNVSIVFERKIAEAPEHEKEAYRALKESLVGKDGAFRQINVTDAQGYCSPTAYRKKALVFGKWSKEAENIYQKLREGKYSYNDLKVAFQPLKPFVYSQIEKETGVEGAPLNSLKVGVQNKNSEYLLILADAILQGENTGKPNLLRAIYEIMEESHYDADGNYKLDGIDTVQFESTVKAGLMGAVDIAKYANVEGGEIIAKAIMEHSIYEKSLVEYEYTDPDTGEIIKQNIRQKTGNYNKNIVHEIPFEDYCLQQEVPEHFKEHLQIHGSQLRYIIPSELSTTAVYNIEGRELSAEDFKKEYEQTIYENIQESLDVVSSIFELDNSNLKERNAAISKILQREILSSPRYGVDLLQACSLDENGEFRIPLGDPIQSKRIEQLLNSIIKNRVNKQEIAGGPVVQVTNFGLARDLNIKFKDKNGNILKTRKEFKGTDAEFKEYLNKNQAGIAYFEVFAPIYTNSLFSKFADKDGSIDIETIEIINPDLLKMIGYRIPTEAKYSAAPLKIVGFLPREAGDGIMLPSDITLLTGSDFDVDKEYLMRKELDIATRFIAKENETMSDAEKEYIKHNKESIADYLIKAVNLQGKATAEEVKSIEKDADATTEVDLRTAEREHNNRVNQIEERNDAAEEAIDNATYSTEEEKNEEIKDKKQDSREKKYQKDLDREEKRYQIEIEKIKARREDTILKKVSQLEKRKVSERINQFLTSDRFISSKADDALTKELRKAYIDYMYHTVAPTKGRTYRNNKIFDMSYEVLTHESSAAEMLNPGGFDEQKHAGYLVEAFRSPLNTLSFEELEKKSIDELKDIISKDKNLMFVDTQIQFYKQNAAAASLIGIFAVHRIAHAVIENEGYAVNIEEATHSEDSFKIADMIFSGTMPLDVRNNRLGNSVGKTLGSLVASAADAVKDPVLNLMNINISTANALLALLRMGMPFRDAALFLSQKSITELLSRFNNENITNNVPLIKVINDSIKDMKKQYSIDDSSALNTEGLSREEIIQGIKESSPNIAYKTLLNLKKVLQLADAIKLPTATTRFNSISSAVGPLVIDNLMQEYKIEKLSNSSSIYDKNGNLIAVTDIMKAHPILGAFYEAFGLAKSILQGLPSNSTGFRNIISYLSDSILGDKIMADRKLLSTLSDFYQSYLVAAGGVVDTNKLEYYITEFPKQFIKENIKEKYKNNPLIQAIKYGTDKAGRATLIIDTVGTDGPYKERLSSAWIDLHRSNPELSRQLFEYCFFRAGMGFSPKTFMNLVPVYVKERIPKYKETFKKFPSVLPEIVIDQFVRNNWDNSKLVSTRKGITLNKRNGTSSTYLITKEEDIDALRGTPYFKMSIDKKMHLYKLISGLELDSELVYEEISPLGSNKDYLELSTEPIQSPMQDTFEVIEEESSDVTDLTPVEEETTRDNVTEKELNDLLLTLFEAPSTMLSVSRETAMGRINQYRKKSQEDKAKLEKSMKNFIESRFKLLNIEYNQDSIDNVYEKLC